MKFLVAGVALCTILMSSAVVEVWRRFVEIDPARIVTQGAFRRREMRWEDVEEAVWHLPPPGCVVLSGPARRMWILFRGFDPDEARLLRRQSASLFPPPLIAKSGSSPPRKSIGKLTAFSHRSRKEGLHPLPPRRLFLSRIILSRLP